MGKSKSKYREKYRSNPTARVVKPPSDPELAALREKHILPVIAQLQSVEGKTRSAAARVITNLIETNKTRKLLLKEQIVKILLEQTLTDSNLETRVDGWGILQNLALAEDVDFSVHLFRRDILTAIEAAGKAITETLQSKDIPFTKLSKPQQQLVWTLASSLISLISRLSEAQDEINQEISQRFTISQFLINLSAQTTPDNVVVEVLNCIGVLLEDNEDLAQQVVGNAEGFLAYLDKIKEQPDLKGVTGCQVLYNLCSSMKWYDHNTPSNVASIASLLPTLAKAIDQSLQKDTSTSNGDSKDSGPDQTIELALVVIASIATGLHEALEHATKPGNVKKEEEFTGFDDSELVDVQVQPKEDKDAGHAMDMEELETGNGEMDEADMLADMEGVTADGPDDDEAGSGSATLNLLIQISTPSIINVIRQNKGHTMQALQTLNNITWAISVIDFTDEHLHETFKLWAELGQQIWNEIVSPVLASDQADLELASITTSIAWAVARCIKGGIKIQPGEPRKFMALRLASKELLGDDKKAAAGDGDDFSTLGVKCIGVLGSLAVHPASIELNREIGGFLGGVLNQIPDTPPAEAVEALDQIFVIYADRIYPYDEAYFWRVNFPRHLEDIQPKLKQMAKGIDKRQYPELRERVDEIALNLRRFLAYKRKERLNSNLIDLGGDSEMAT